MRLINVHTHRFTDDPDILEVVNQYPQDFDASVPQYSIGIHPWYIVEQAIESNLAVIEDKLQQDSCLAIGECGLDKRIELPLELQIRVFEAQLELAQKHRKPVIVHCVAAFQELVETRRRLHISVPMVVHGFAKNAQTAKQLLSHGFYLSFGKYLMRNPELESVFCSIPEERFFLETDTTDEPLIAVYELAARYRKTCVETIARQMARNFKQVFELELD